MPASETLELLVNLKGTGIQGLKDLQAEIHKVASSSPPAVTGLKNIRGEAKQTADTIQNQLIPSFASLKKALVGIGSAIGISLGVSALVTSVKNAVSVFAEFDDTMRQVKAISGATNEEFKEMTELAKKMGEETRFTAVDAAKTLRILAQAGFSVRETIGALPSVMTLASAGMVDLSQAAEIASSAMNSYGLTAKDLPSINNVLVRAVNDTNAELSDLGVAFQYVAPIARGLGADFEDLVGAMGLLKQVFKDGSRVGTALVGMLSALFNPTKEEAELMALLSKRIGGAGLQIRNSQGQFIGFLEIVKQLEKAGFDGAEAMKLFGDRAGPGMAAMLNIGSARLAELNGFLRETDDIAGKVSKEMEAGIGGALRELDSALEGVQVAFGETFGEDIQQLIITVKNYVLDLIGVINEMKGSGALTGWARDVIQAFQSIYAVIDFAVIGPLNMLLGLMVRVGTTFRGMMAVIRGEMSTADFIKSNFEELSARLGEITISPVLAKMKTELSELEKEIKATAKRITQAEREIGSELDQSIDLEEEKRHLADLQNQWDILASKVTEYGKRLNKIPTMEEDVTSRAAGVDTRPARGSELHNIGRAGAKASKIPPPVETEAQKKAMAAASAAALAQAAADQKELQALLEEAYATGLIAYKENIAERARITDEYYQGQINAAIAAADKEIAILQATAKKAPAGSAERIKAESEIVVRRKELSAELIQIETRRYQEEIRLAEEAKQKKIQLENTMADIRIRTQVSGMEPGVDREFTEEKLRLDERHRLEMEALKKLTIEKANLEDLSRAQELEKQRLHEEQVSRLRMAQLDIAKQVTGGISDLFDNLYEATGKNTKAFFYISKAAAIAEATINIAQGITKALAQGGYWGIAQGAAVAAAGAAQLAKISSQQLAEGGLVEGKSPSTKADDKLISATSGEYMQPVKAVRHYGMQFMNAIRNLSFPRDLASAFASRYPISSPSKSRFAEGGMVGPASGRSTSQGDEKGLTINNFIDPNLFGQYLASTPGRRQFMNVIGDNRIAVRDMLFSNG